MELGFLLCPFLRIFLLFKAKAVILAANTLPPPDLYPYQVLPKSTKDMGVIERTRFRLLDRYIWSWNNDPEQANSK